MTDANECSICYENTNTKGTVKTQCNHLYCVDCFIKHTRRSSDCAYCRKKLTDEQPIKKPEENNISSPEIITGGLFNLSSSSFSVIRPPLYSPFISPSISNYTVFPHLPSTPITTEEVDSMFNDLSEQIVSNILENSGVFTVPQEMEREGIQENTQEDTRGASREFTEWIINAFRLR